MIVCIKSFPLVSFEAYPIFNCLLCIAPPVQASSLKGSCPTYSLKLLSMAANDTALTCQRLPEMKAIPLRLLLPPDVASVSLWTVLLIGRVMICIIHCLESMEADLTLIVFHTPQCLETQQAWGRAAHLLDSLQRTSLEAASVMCGFLLLMISIMTPVAI